MNATARTTRCLQLHGYGQRLERWMERLNAELVASVNDLDERELDAYLTASEAERGKE